MPHSRRTTEAPDADCIEHGAKYYCQIDRGWRRRSGRILDEQGAVRWLYRVRGSASGRGWANPFNKPDFVVEDAYGQVELIVRRASFLPPVFQVVDGNDVIGRIRMTSALRNKYAFDIESVGSWTFQMPLFTVQFRGYSDTGTDIWVAVGPSEMEWSILIRPGIDDRQLLATLAFIHNERCHYG